MTLELLQSEMDDFVASLPNSSVRPIIAESWDRCRRAEITPTSVPLHRVTDEDLARRLAASADLIEIARAHIDWASTALGGVAHVVYLVDADGVVLHVTGTDQSAMETAGLLPGYDWSEHRMGTNGAGTALASQCAVAVQGSEHYADAFKHCTCTAAPIRDPAGKVIGAIDITTGAIPGAAARLSLASHAAYAVEQELRLRAALRAAEQHAEARRRAEQDLLVSQARYRTLLENLPGSAVGLFDRELRFVVADGAVLSAVGLSREGLEGRTIWESLPRELAASLEGPLQAALGGGESAAPPVELSFADRTFMARAVALRDAAGRVSHVMALGHDITERTRIEAALRESEERFRSLSACSPVGIFVTDLLGRCQYANQRSQAIAGCTLDEALGEGWTRFVHPDDRGRVFSHWAAHVQGGREYSSEVRWQHRDGGVRWTHVRAAPLRLDGGRLAGFVGTVEDITGRREAERRLGLLQEVTARLGSALDTAAIAEVVITSVLAALDAEGGSLIVRSRSGDSAQIVRGIGFSVEADRAWLDVPIPLDWSTPITDAIRSGLLVELESLEQWRERYPEHALFHEQEGYVGHAVIPCEGDGYVQGAISLSFRSPRLLSDGERAFVTAVARQCGQALERAVLYEAERAARAQAEAAVGTRDEVLAIVAHDLRSPLDRISASTSMLLDETLPEDSRRKFLGVIQRSTSGLSRLLSDLLDAASIEAGRLAVDRQPLPVAPLVVDAGETFQPQAAERGVRLEWSASPDVSNVVADSGRIRQVLSNLLSNAVRLTPAGGQIRIGAERDGEMVRLSVSDTGPGIAPEDLGHLFERFWQAKRSHRGSAGLGLAICKGIVEAHGGRIWVESAVGRGSVFYFALPASPE